MMMVPVASEGDDRQASSSIPPVPTAMASLRASNVFGLAAPNHAPGIVMTR